MSTQRVRCDTCGHLTGLAGPEGGYVCGRCWYVVEPAGYGRLREAGLKVVAADRQARAQARREHTHSRP
ncbi:hypothetical protein ABZ348_23490 [Streptomyces sp. NPDC005963]|uniref:hypothetical protein n=1 Tax=Streptomyces sp. NPDC005963 TaxID=3156721 RepID=UPI0033DBF6C5